MERILVGVDRSAGAKDALDWSAQIAERVGLELVAVRVLEPTRTGVWPDQGTPDPEAQRRELEEWCSDIRTAVEPRTVLVDGDAADALLHAAAEYRADLLVVGERGSGGFANLHVGSVAHHLTHHTTMPLAMVPAGTAPRPDHLVVGVDGSEASLGALDLSADLGTGLGVSVTAVHAFEPFVEWAPESDPDSWRTHAEDEAKAWVEPLVQAGVNVDVVVDRDINPAGAISRALDDHRGATALVGTRGVGGFPGLRLGRVPLQLVHQVSSPVIVVPAPATR